MTRIVNRWRSVTFSTGKCLGRHAGLQKPCQISEFSPLDWTQMTNEFF